MESARRRFPLGGDEIVYFRTVLDYRRPHALSETERKLAVIGGGFIGSEIAAALTLNEKEVVMIFSRNEIGERIFPRTLAQFVPEFERLLGQHCKLRVLFHYDR